MYTGKEGVIGRVGRSILVGQGAVEFLCFDLYRSTSTGRAEHWPHSIRQKPAETSCRANGGCIVDSGGEEAPR